MTIETTTMKLITLSTLLAATSAFAPPLTPARCPLPSTSLSAAAALPKLPNPYASLPWVVEREEARTKKQLEFDNAALFRELGLACDATYEDVKEKTDALIGMYNARKDVKKRIQVEIARDKIYMIRLNERVAGVSKPNWGAQLADAYDRKGSEGLMEITGQDEALKEARRARFRIPVISGLAEYMASVYVPPDPTWAKRNMIVWGISTLVCLVNPPLTESFARVNWLAAGGMMGYRGMPGMDPADREAGYNPFRGKRNKIHQVRAMGIAIAVWVAAKAFAEAFVMKWPVLVASRSCEWFKFAIVQGMLGLSTSYIQTYTGEDTGDLMI